MKQYQLTVPPTLEMGSYSTIMTEGPEETKAKTALWIYNNARVHDGLSPLNRMPKGTKYIPID